MKLSLRYLIIFMALLSVVLTMTGSIMSGSRVSKDSLVENTLEMNRVYAQKIAHSTETFLEETIDTLSYSANEIAEYFNHENGQEMMMDEVERLSEQMSTFNSVAVMSKEGIVLAISSKSSRILGQKVDSEGGIQALSERKPTISNPYWTMTDRLAVLISHPIFDSSGNFLGSVAGTIYLLENNILNELLGEHFYQDGSYVFVVDGEGNIIYHPNPSRINESAEKNPAVKETMDGKSGVMRLVNSQGIDMLAGYADIPLTNWGTVSQTETEIALRPAIDMRQEMILKALPFLVVSLLIIILIANHISKPLEKLGDYAENSLENGSYKKVKNIQAWYLEARQLKAALVKSFALWEDKVNYFIYQSTTDPLTGLANRRFMNEKIQKWEETNTYYSIILLDIDRFKLVNDTYGHSIGDEVLKFLAAEMRAAIREGDTCCRYGGEEFIILLPDTTLEDTFKIAENLRKVIENKVSPTGNPITISGGIANYPLSGDHAMQVIEVADAQLYRAKENGRNKICGEDYMIV